MVTAAVALRYGAGVLAAVDGSAAPPVPHALRAGKYPWYDAARDSVRPIVPKARWNWDWVIALAIIALALVAFTGMLVWLWLRYEPGLAESQAEARRRAGASRIEGLPEGLRPETDDPWNEALRRRDRGDYAGAVVCLFAHQLLTLDRLRLLRLVPGRTGRQLVRAIDDAAFRGCVEPTLRLFEAVYYGHRVPPREAFEALWVCAEQFEQRAGAGART
jgi:hypothetical protein